MGFPRLFRDPVHDHIAFAQVDLKAKLPDAVSAPTRSSWVLQKLIDTQEFQRLRFIRQNGLANLAFQGAEHSRFVHSIGTSHVARSMYGNVVRNMSEPHDSDLELEVATASLLHDIGHGPFSHTLEDMLSDVEVQFDHEYITARYILERDSSTVSELLHKCDAQLPKRIAGYIAKSERDKDAWTYKIVSSQLDADRLDYLQRDALEVGARGYAFDRSWLLEKLMHHNGIRIAVHRKGLVALEQYLQMLDHMYRTVYYHHTVRAASVLLSSILRRAFELVLNGDHSVFGGRAKATRDPLYRLLKDGQNIDLRIYTRLGEFKIWAWIDEWQSSKDPILADLSKRIFRRELPKAIELTSHEYPAVRALEDKAIEVTTKLIPTANQDTVKYYVSVDSQSRTSYRLYDWHSEAPDESIWIAGSGTPVPIEQDNQSRIIGALKVQRYFDRLIVCSEVRDVLTKPKPTRSEKNGRDVPKRRQPSQSALRGRRRG